MNIADRIRYRDFDFALPSTYELMENELAARRHSMGAHVHQVESDSYLQSARSSEPFNVQTHK